ncbi:MAG TPA: hypothetical protein VE825_02590 [Terriglobales bacterium]|jgi:hypothetical protein|nr:hypothetical protein [Terriglobales bacterium]
MKRPKLVTTVALLQLAWGTFLAVFALWNLWEGYSLHITGFWTGAARTLAYITAELSGAGGLILLAADYGLWKRRGWGWFLALVANAVGAALTFPNLASDVSASDICVPLVFAVAVVLLLLPGVRGFFFPRSQATRGPSGAAS